jgi:hypothetical protein
MLQSGTGKSSGSWVIASTVFPVIQPVTYWLLLSKYSGGPARDSHPLPFSTLPEEGHL